jgi:hypothetical protein
MACVRVFVRVCVCVRACAHGGSVVRFRLTVTMLTPREHAACDRGCVPVRFCSHQQKV